MIGDEVRPGQLRRVSHPFDQKGSVYLVMEHAPAQISYGSKWLPYWWVFLDGKVQLLGAHGMLEDELVSEPA